MMHVGLRRVPWLGERALCCKSSNWVVSRALGKLKLCAKYSALCFIMNYFVYLSKVGFLFGLFSAVCS